MSVRKRVLGSVGTVLLAACPALGFGAADTVFFGGPVITMDSDGRVVEALAVEDGRIIAVGDRAKVLALADEDTYRVDLDGAPLLPGFVDSHSHANFIGLQALSADILPPPDGGGASVADIQNILREYLKSEPALLRELGWVIGFGYDDSQLAEQRHPTRQEMDAVSTEVPILLIHQSGHLGVANSLGLKMAGIGPDTPDPDGGAFRRESDGKQPNGVAEEYAFFHLIFSALAKSTDELQDRMALAGAETMARYGYTTAQEGRANPEGVATLKRVADRNALAIDVVAYPDMLMFEDVPVSRDYNHRFRIGGVKLTIDGSPQGKTAWLSHPYHVPPQGQDEDYLGYPAIDVETVNTNVMRAFENGWQILVHSNGDAATDALIGAVRAARKKYPSVENRPVLIHGQVLRKEQVAALDELHIFPSLFPMHTFYWGDWHRDSVLGPERAQNISPTGWVRERGMMFGSHHDAPVANPDSMRVLAATVTRTTRSGEVLGPQHRVDVMTGLRALTIWPAWQHFEEDRKGSLEVGKLADLVVLSDNPLSVDPGDLEDLTVQSTYKEGQLVYQRDQ
ncbi:amidohydrolase [Congregibacter litoralis]|uniref:Putative metal-dependent hydrolase with the TIM-barrel fold protein n=1 Tax=Congregibacter litoralis KT71 TaxID=314285 RepID=A4AA70_9GAMM|nr:amidohydrolase [Congregibacter litoralis]EAQ96947.2 putative metal-dependent hydrolase with the TIM-barrel fold protein [Congregibacter litoralis KT71]